MANLFVPAHLLEKLHCVSCKGYLSVFPVYIKSDGSDAVCGRCKIGNEDDYLRDEAYENLATFLMFPCTQTANGCTEQLPPPKLKEHEMCCKHRKLGCPSKMYSKCQWMGAASELKAHFESKHTALLLKENKFEVNFVSSYKENMLLPLNDELFIVKKEVDSRSNTFWCSAEHVSQKEDSEKFSYFIRIESGNQTYFHKFPQKSTLQEEEDKITKFSLDFAREQLHDPASILAHIEIVKTVQQISEEVNKAKKVNNPNVDLEQLSEVECPICFDYMLPPIFQCLNGHSICSECKYKITECPLCKGGIGITQNFALEKLTQRMIYPCKYNKLGCVYTSKASVIKVHEDNCEYGPYDCPLKETEDCEIKSNSSDIIGHVENNHLDYILKSDKISIPFNTNHQSDEKCYLIKFSSRIFKVFYKYENERFHWAVQLVGPAIESKNYKYEIDIIDNSGNNQRHYMKSQCIPPTAKEGCFKNKKNYVRVDYEQIEDFIVNSLSYRIRIIKE